MTVNELTERCYETIIIYTAIDKEYLEYKDLFKGKKENIPKYLSGKEVKCFGAKRKGIIEISV